MKTIKWIFIATMVIALFSCNNINGYIMEDTSIESPIFEGDTRSDTTSNDNTDQNDTTDGGMGATITDWGDGGTADITMYPD